MRLNGFPVPLSAGEINENRTLVALPYLLEGDNEIQLRFTDVRPLDEGEVPFVSFRLEQEIEEELFELMETSRQVDRREDPESGEVSYTEVFETEFPGKYSQRQSNTLENGVSAMEIDLASASVKYQTFPRENPRITVTAQLDAARLTSLPWLLPGGELDEAGRTEIRQFISSLHSALMNQDIEALKAAFLNKNQRIANAFGVPIEQVESAQEEFYSQLFAVAGYTVLPLDTNQLEFTPISEVNLVHVTGPDGGAVLTIDSDELVFSLQFFFSEIESQWLFVE
ncbi:MAG: hypothetical protein AB3N33_09890 [Puniceicoccaceae bacterium]